jgi:hypothetical protein
LAVTWVPDSATRFRDDNRWGDFEVSLSVTFQEPALLNTRHLLLAATALALLATTAQAAERRTTPLADGWRFVQGDPEGAETATLDDSRWATVSVPHDWAIAGPFDVKARAGGAGGFLPTGVAWYRRTLDVKPRPAAGCSSSWTG